MARIDFHTHSFFSDGALLPEEMARRLETLDHEAFALTDHAGPSNLKETVEKISEAARYVNESFSIQMISGVELTHVHPKDIPILATKAKEYGAQIVVVHGETLTEPVMPGTNMAAVSCTRVDILAHPGLLKKEEARTAERNGIFVELTTRQGHSLGNGLVGRLCKAEMLLLNTDSHAPSDFITEGFALKAVMASGLEEGEAEIICQKNPQRVLEKIR